MAERAYMVNSVVKCLAIIETLANQGPSSLADLKNILGLDKATLHRILSTLKALDYVKQNPSDQRYFLTFKIFQTGNLVMERGGFKSLIHPYLEKISADFQELIYASVMTEPGQALCIDKTEVDLYQQLRLNVSIGGQVSMHASSMGRCFLAFMNPENFPKVIAGLHYEKFTPVTIAEPGLLAGELEKVRRTGYALEEGERIEGAMCIGVPILNSQGHAHAAISATGPIGRMMLKKEGLIRALTDASKELSIICGLPPERWPIQPLS
ncbi:MAG: IclR family transcriptional regulator [Candidatus Adiutrix sp.]|jgi:IclR family acetate operon transcriptional repressor|nr:IclR family transcriptional regulator [Candidatus Adiutrix sp.]